jgi:hypothetical protein
MPGAVAPIAAPGSLERETEAALQAAAAVAASRGSAPTFEKPAIAVLGGVTTGHFSDAAVGQFLAALGRDKTQPVYRVVVAGPTPLPAPSVAPGVSNDYAQWHDADTYAAVTRALAATTVKVQVTQEPVAPSRMKSLYLSDQSAGLAYTIARRKRLDFDAAATTGHNGFEPGVGLDYHLTNQASLYGGIAIVRGKPAPAVGFAVSF